METQGTLSRKLKPKVHNKKPLENPKKSALSSIFKKDSSKTSKRFNLHQALGFSVIVPSALGG
jgi:hypothetical protein